ncbi:MAG: hypothetical protein LBS00_05485, partial [Synergistaceae bacterium]|nr:hypothetical protein [Synergistaceae bacterium]
PVLTGTTDTALEVYAAGAVHEGDATVKLATAGRICPITTHPIKSPHFFNYKHVVDGLWYPGTGTRTCAASYKWYKEQFGGLEDLEASQTDRTAFQLLDEGAAKTPAGCDNLFFHPYLLGEMSPYQDAALRASFVGASSRHGKGHFSRAVMEGVGYSMKDCLEEILKHDVTLNGCRIIGGGAKSPLWRQIVADMFDMPLTYSPFNDSSLGAAMLAAVTAGIFVDPFDGVGKCLKAQAVVYPIPENVKIYERGFRVYKEIQQGLAEIYHRISRRE